MARLQHAAPAREPSVAVQPPTSESWSPDDSLRHFAYQGLGRAVNAWWRLIRPDDAPPPARGLIRMLDFGSEWYGDPSGVGWASYMRGMLREIIVPGWAPGTIDPVAHMLATYPPHDVQAMPEFTSASFEIVVVDNVLEHVERPWLAATELHRVLRPGGLCVAMTPGLYPIHPSPLDCWRIMPDGYHALFPGAQWETLTVGTWGNLEQLAWELRYNGAFPDGPPALTVEEAHVRHPKGYVEGGDGRFPLMVWWVGVKR